MALSEHVQIADAIVGELNSDDRGWYGSLHAERSWLPDYKPEDLVELRVAVVPLAMEQTQFTRDKDEFTFGIPVSFQKKVDPNDRNYLDELDKLVQDVHDWFRDSHRLTGLTSYEVLDATRPAVYALDRLYSERIWETLVTVTVRGWRS